MNTNRLAPRPHAGRGKEALGEPDPPHGAGVRRYGPEGSLRINPETGPWKDSETKEGGNFPDPVQREL